MCSSARASCLSADSRGCFNRGLGQSRAQPRAQPSSQRLRLRQPCRSLHEVLAPVSPVFLPAVFLAGAAAGGVLVGRYMQSQGAETLRLSTLENAASLDNVKGDKDVKIGSAQHPEDDKSIKEFVQWESGEGHPTDSMVHSTEASKANISNDDNLQLPAGDAETPSTSPFHCPPEMLEALRNPVHEEDGSWEDSDEEWMFQMALESFMWEGKYFE